MIQVEAYIKFLVNVAKQCTLWERALKIRFRLDLWLSCLLTSDFYRWLWIRSYSFVKKGRENFLYKTETNSFHFFHFDKVESLSTLYYIVFDFGNFGLTFTIMETPPILNFKGFQGPDHGQMTKVNCRLKVNWNDVAQITIPPNLLL